MKKIFVILMASMMLFNTLLMPTYAIQFSDLSEEHWAYENIMSLVERGVVNGYEDGTYKPSKTITRAEFFKLLMVSAYGEEGITSSGDVSSHWAMPYYNVAEYNGLLMDGTSSENLNDSITRLEMAVVLAKTTFAQNIMKSISGEIEPVEFIDIDNLSEENQLYINHVADLGLINGYEDKSFKPNNNMTRAEVATVINRYLTAQEFEITDEEMMEEEEIYE